ncbi:hypothetical protein GQ54DRAFT_162897 [Martensiomyces pterosporus]|nr:hypothetical protein GQ54DRAFT_162897 [Martensiomyces pterosporus]
MACGNWRQQSMRPFKLQSKKKKSLAGEQLGWAFKEQAVEPLVRPRLLQPPFLFLALSSQHPSSPQHTTHTPAIHSMLFNSAVATLAACVLGACHASAMAITCAGFEALPTITYDNVAPQALERVVIAFKPDTPAQILDSFRDALMCRGSTIDAPNYNTNTLTGLTSKLYADDLKKSNFIASVELNNRVTALRTPTAKPTSLSKDHSSEASSYREHSSRHSSSEESEFSDLDSFSESDSGLETTSHTSKSGSPATFTCGMALALAAAAAQLL